MSGLFAPVLMAIDSVTFAGWFGGGAARGVTLLVRTNHSYVSYLMSGNQIG